MKGFLSGWGSVGLEWDHRAGPNIFGGFSVAFLRREYPPQGRPVS